MSNMYFLLTQVLILLIGFLIKLIYEANTGRKVTYRMWQHYLLGMVISLLLIWLVFNQSFTQFKGWCILIMLLASIVLEVFEVIRPNNNVALLPDKNSHIPKEE